MKIMLNDVAKRLAGFYLQISGSQVTCALTAEVAEYSDRELEIFSDNTDKIAILFGKGGRFEMVGYDGKWYRVLTMPPVKDLDIVLSVKNLEEFGLIEVMGKNPGRNWLAIVR